MSLRTRDPAIAAKRSRDPSPSSAASGEPEVTARERDLASDAQWKLIQKNTFTRWANEHLKTVNRNIADLETDLSDGLRLISLIEVLARKRFQRYNKRPTIRTQKLENITMALRFLQAEEKIKIVNIDSSDIVDQKLKLILGLIWTLILHYSISMPSWGDEDDHTVQKKEQTPKQRLLAWIQNRVTDRHIGNFTSDWNDGRAIGALVDGVAPGLCPDWEDWDTKDALANTTEAMNSAEQWLDVPQLIRPEEMCNSKVDELSMMTYLSQFPNAQLKPGAPLRPRTNASRVRAYGPGLYASGNSVGAPARFTVETFSAGKGELDVTVVNPNGAQQPHEVVFNNDQYLTYSCSYTPTMEGTYKVHVRFANREIPKSPFVVEVEGMAGDPTKVTASGPGLEKKGNMVKKKTGFDVFTKNAGFGVVDVVVTDPHGDKNSVRPKMTQVSDDQWRVEYTPSVEGRHSINIFFAGTPIPVSPVSINVSPMIDPTKCIASGRGIQGTGLRVNDKAPFRIQTKSAGSGGHLGVKVTGPGSTEESVAVDKTDDTTYDCCYVPRKPGRYVVDVSYDDRPISKSPFEVRVLPARECLVRAYGPGLFGGMVGYPSRFTVETNGETGVLGFSIEGPSQSKIDCQDNEDGSAEISYVPLAPGEYAVHILVDNEDINGSPFMADVRPASADFDPSKVEVYGKGLQPFGLTVGDPAEFTVDTRKAGTAAVDVALFDVDQNPIGVSINDCGGGKYTCQYLPTRNVRHAAVISFGGLAVPGSPFRMMIKERSDPNKVKVFGPAFTDKVLTFEPTYFIVDCMEAGPGDIKVEVHDSKHNSVMIKTSDSEDKTYTVAFEPLEVGEYSARIQFADQDVPGCPRKFTVQPSVDLSRVRVHGLEEKVFVDSPVEFFIDLQSVASASSENLKVILTAPSGDKMEANVAEKQDGTHRCSFSVTEKGRHSIEIRYSGLPIPSSPFQLNAMEGCDPSKVRAFGPGLTDGWTSKTQRFTVDTKNAGKGGLGLAVEGPSEAKTTCRDNRDGTCDVEYLPTKRGIYDVAVRFAENHIPGSPFRVCIKDELNPDRVRCFGSVLDLKQVRIGRAVSFTVDASDAGEADLDVVVVDQNGVSHRPDVISQGNGLFEVSYHPKVEGQHKVNVSYGNRPVPDSPFLLNVLPKSEASRVKLLGEGLQGPVLASLPTSFVVDTTDAGDASLEVAIKDKDDKEIRHQMAKTKDKCQTVTYTTDSVGRHRIDVNYGGVPVTSSPFFVDVAPAGDASSVKIIAGTRSVVPVGEECSIIVDRSTAGVGNVTCDIDGDVKSKVTSRDGTVEVVYALPRSGIFNVQLKFGGQPIPDGCFEQEALDVDDYRNYLEEQEAKLASTLSTGLMNGVYANGIDDLDSGLLLYNPVDFTISVGPVFGFVKAEVTTPSGKNDWPKVIDNKNGTVTIRYQPTEIGLHQLDVKYNDCPVNGSPFQFTVDAVRAGKVTAHGGGLMQGIAGNKCSFIINTGNNNSSGLVVLIEGPSKTDIHVEDNDDNTCTVSYTPMLPGDYQVFIKFADHNIAGSPYTAKILPASADDVQVVHLSVGSSKSEISLMIEEPDVEALAATIRSPSGREASCVLKQLVNGQLGISFCPKEKGRHAVSVLRSGRHINKSPFQINIVESQLCRVDKVRAFGKGLTEGRTNEFVEFLVNCKEAGFGNLSLSIEGPGKVQMNCREEEVGFCLVRYKPLEPGTYIVHVKFADDDINGSPFLVPVKGQSSSEHNSEKITDALDIAEITHIGCECRLRLTIKGVDLKDLEANVVDPSYLKKVCRVSELEQGLFSVDFVPQEVGVHTVRVQHRGVDIPGSPYRFTVGPILEGGAGQVQVTGDGLNGGRINQPGHFNVSTRKAGSGNLSIVMEGPSRAEITIRDRLDGSCDASYVCSQQGEYWLSVRFNGEHVSNSPFQIPVAPSDDNKETLTSTVDDVCQVRRPTSLLLNMIGSGGRLDATVIDPSGLEDQAFVQQLNNGRAAVRFIPHSNGLHIIQVKRNGCPVYGSPFQVFVGKQEPNPALVRAQGEGLRKGQTGQPTKFFVYTSGAGPGALTVTIDGPSKVEVVCRELDNGFELSYVPRAPGFYQIGLTYGGTAHIPNSPFMAHVEGPGRPSAWNEQSQVIVESTANSKRTSSEQLTISPKEAASLIASEGPGLHKGLVNKESVFTVDTSRAGQGILLVGVTGPGGPCEEVSIKHMGSGHYAVSYQPKESGNYLVVIRWGDQHIPGSPFQVLVQ